MCITYAISRFYGIKFRQETLDKGCLTPYIIKLFFNSWANIIIFNNSKLAGVRQIALKDMQ